MAYPFSCAVRRVAFLSSSALRSDTPRHCRGLLLALWRPDYRDAAAPCSYLNGCHPRPVNGHASCAGAEPLTSIRGHTRRFIGQTAVSLGKANPTQLNANRPQKTVRGAKNGKAPGGRGRKIGFLF